ncbi:YqcI/YcgG family protein [Streptomyces sp. NPDC093261]|uniref:YqcI/YcgG family protein n=1 Tax=Streptomyces sp. NPDC093261 TaxID=3366037 RepID=UPI0038047A55
MARIQEAVRRMVEDRGPYWAPDPPDAYLAERVAALREAFGGAAADRSTAGRHLAEVIVAAVALANGYGIPLQQAFNEASWPADLTEASLWPKRPLPLPEAVARLAAAAEPVRRTMAFHRSDARQGSDPSVVALRRALPALLRAAIAGFASYEELGEELVRLLESTPGRERAAEAEFDPSRAESVRLIRPIQTETFCPFAQKSVLWGPPSYDEQRSFEDNMTASLPPLRRFLRILDRDVIDGFVYAFPTRVFGDTFDDLAQVFRDFVEFLHRNLTEAAPAGLDPAIATDSRWYFVLEGEECFISVFAPCYPHDHSRYMNGVEGHFLFMLQPEAAILRVLTKDDYHARTEAIRRRFRDGFQRYPVADLEIDRFLLPLRADDPPVRWYELDPTL